MELLTLASFAPHVGPGFRLYVDGDRAIDLELADVKTLGASAGGVVRAAAGREPFALYFKGPATFVLPQRIYRIEHAAVGQHDIFIVPVGPGRGGMMYEAIFT